MAKVYIPDIPFIRRWMRYVDNQESPRIFHLWAAVMATSVMTARRVWMPQGVYTIYTNMYLALVADSAMLRKGAPVSLALKLVHKTRERLKVAGMAAHQAAIVSGEVTREALFRALSGAGLEHEGATGGTKDENGHTSRPTILVAPELGAVISPRAFSTGFSEVLTDRWEGPDHRQYLTKGQGVDEVWKAYVSLFGACTPQWVRRRTVDAGIDEGFLGRFLLVYGDARHCMQPTPTLPEDADDLIKLLTTDLYRAGIIQGVARLNPDAQQIYEDWYCKLPERPEDPRTDVGSLGRRHVMMLKVALILHIMYASDLLVTAQDVQDAIRMIADVEALRPRIFFGAEFHGDSPSTTAMEARIREAGTWLTRSELLNGIYRQFSRVEDIDETLQMLIDAGKVTVSSERTGTRGPRTTRYRWKEN
jgi:hypothetical protein